MKITITFNLSDDDRKAIAAFLDGSNDLDAQVIRKANYAECKSWIEGQHVGNLEDAYFEAFNKEQF